MFWVGENNGYLIALLKDGFNLTRLWRLWWNQIDHLIKTVDCLLFFRSSKSVSVKLDKHTTIIIIIIISTWSMTKYLLFYQLISIVASESDSVWTCNLTNTSQPSSFCKEITIPISVCTDDGIFDDNQRSQKGYNKQFSQCSTKSKRKNTCPNNPTRCKQDVFNKTTYCGAHDQTCSVSSSCLSYCYSDCYPCNSRSNCDTLVAFGIAAPPNTTCFSLGRGIIPHSKVIQLIQHASAASP